MKYGVVFLLMLLVGCTSNPVILPGTVGALADKTETRAAILEGMSRRGWVVEDESEGEIVARLNVRSHVAKTRIDYSGKQVTFSYAGSENLNCRPKGDSCRSIHRKYNYWLVNLNSDISSALMLRR